jgi:hypothetical protein
VRCGRGSVRVFEKMGGDGDEQVDNGEEGKDDDEL